MLEVRTWFGAMLWDVRQVRGPEVTVGALGADLFVPLPGEPVVVLEDRGGWRVWEGGGLQLDDAPDGATPLRYRRIEAGRPASISWGDWRLELAIVEVPAPIGRPRERPAPWLALVGLWAMLATGFAAAPEAPTYELEELPNRGCFLNLGIEQEVPASLATSADPLAGAGADAPALAAGTGVDLALSRVGGAVGGDPPIPAGEGIGPGTGYDGEGPAAGTAGEGATGSGRAAEPPRWTLATTDDRAHVLARSGAADFERILANLRAGRDVGAVAPEALAQAFAPRPATLVAEVVPHPSRLGRRLVRVVAPLGHHASRPVHLGVLVDGEALDGHEAQARDWVAGVARRLPDGSRLTVWGGGVRAAAEVSAHAPGLRDRLGLWHLGPAVPHDWVPDDLDAVLAIGAAPPVWTGLPTAVAELDRMRPGTEGDVAAGLVRGSGVQSVALDLDAERVVAWRVLGFEGAHLADVAGRGSHAVPIEHQTGWTVLVAELEVAGAGAPGVARALDAAGEIVAEAPIVEGRMSDVARTWAAAGLAEGLAGVAVDWDALHAASAGSSALAEAIRLARKH